MTSEIRERTPGENKTIYWAKMALSVRKGIRMHRVSNQMTKDPETRKRPWGNVTEHCLVEVARAEVLGRWIGLPEDLILDMKMGAILHDFSKRQEITATREANQNGNSPLTAVKKVQSESEQILIDAGFDERVRRLASGSGYAPQIIEAQRILDQSTLSDEDWAYLIVHYVDDSSVGSDWVSPSQIDTTGRRTNIIDVKTEANKAKSVYQRIIEEIGEELRGSKFEGMNNHDAMFIVSHGIERRLVQRIAEKTGETINPLLIPELVDQKIKMAIEGKK